MPKKIELTGKRFGRLVVIEISEEKPDKGGSLNWACECDCGEKSIASSSNLKSGNTRSCGCLQKETRVENQRKSCYKHGLYRSKEHRAWSGMIDRCTNPRANSYDSYGGRGITVCERWRKSFSSFYEDMGLKPSDNHSLDRIDNNGDYEPGNVRWATPIEQNNNTRANVRIAIKGRTDTLANWCRITSLNYDMVRMRISRGWEPEKALEIE